MPALPHKNTAILLLALLYYTLTVLPHAWFGTTLNNWVFKSWSRGEYDNVVRLIATIGAIILGGVLLYAWRKNKLNQWNIVVALISSVLGMVIWKLLFVINIEAIHFIQYAVLAFLLYQITRDHFLTHLFCLALGAFDEAYQYFYLAPDATFYYDMNDVITNLVGAGMGLAFCSTQSPTKVHKASATLFAKSLSALWVLPLLISFFFIPADHPFAILKKPISSWWYPVPQSDAYFHIVGPIDGLLYVAILMWLYHWLYQKLNQSL